MLVFNFVLQISKSLILSEAEILVWAHLQGRESLISCIVCLRSWSAIFSYFCGLNDV